MITFVYSAVLGASPAFSWRRFCSSRSRWVRPSRSRPSQRRSSVVSATLRARSLAAWRSNYRDLRRGLHIRALQGCIRLPCPYLFSPSGRRVCSANASRKRHECCARDEDGGVRPFPLGRRPRCLCDAAVAAVVATATVRTDGYVAIFMQAVTYAIACSACRWCWVCADRSISRRRRSLRSAPTRSRSARWTMTFPFSSASSRAWRSRLRQRAARPVDTAFGRPLPRDVTISFQQILTAFSSMDPVDARARWGGFDQTA